MRYTTARLSSGTLASGAQLALLPSHAFRQGALRPEQRLEYAGRREAASPATGSSRVHKSEQAALLAHAFGLPD